MEQLVVFTLGEQGYALPLNTVVRVVHAVEITLLPKAPPVISGIINVKGQIIPVVDIRKRFGLTPRELIPDDQLIIADTGKRQVALLVDEVRGIENITSRQLADTKETIPFAEYIKGIVKIENELILIYDLEQFLNLHEEMELERALKPPLTPPKEGD